MPTVAPDAMVYQLLCAGIKGLVLKTDPIADLLRQQRHFGKIDCTFPAQLRQPLSAITCAPIVLPVEYAPTAHHLTLREQEVAQLLAEGRASKEVGDILGISYRTANTHRSNLMRKLSIHNCAALTLYAATHLLIKDPRFTVLANVAELSTPALKTRRQSSVDAR